MPAPPAALDLLMDLEIPIHIRLGRTTLLLGEVLALDPGSLVMFSHPPEEPADLVVNGQVVARGAVVQVQGNYGLRITEVVAPPNFAEGRNA